MRVFVGFFIVIIFVLIIKDAISLWSKAEEKIAPKDCSELGIKLDNMPKNTDADKIVMAKTIKASECEKLLDGKLKRYKVLYNRFKNV